jgi:hypothetical protein
VKEIEMLIRSLQTILQSKLPEGTRPRELHISFDNARSTMTIEIDTERHAQGHPRFDMEIPMGVSDCKSGVLTTEEGDRNE